MKLKKRCFRTTSPLYRMLLRDMPGYG